ncbi:chemokine-like protein TAFA-5 isoform X2 [Lagopus muta]|uniref:chemokine-like protein TAFA-5 isoform X2 n=1 Tax=Lagopus muta TaxID=64668 RepID=UPI0020A15504|nr:chemokine-like protein TAFA-5 isoform X2 [Lagopus muta]
MAPSPRRSSRKDANALPSMSSTFWAIMILASLLIAYCSQLAAGTCEIVTLDRDSSQPRRTIARQTARCACKKGQIAGTTRARPACVDARIIKTKQWCEMLPCLEGEGCDLLINKSGWTCTQPGGRIKTTTVPPCWRLGPAMPCSGSVGVSWHKLFLKQKSPSLPSSQRAPVAPLLSKPCHGHTVQYILLFHQ